MWVGRLVGGDIGIINIYVPNNPIEMCNIWELFIGRISKDYN